MFDTIFRFERKKIARDVRCVKKRCINLVSARS